jgi:crossover junction endodeoxyribonuclease RusA
MPSVEFVVRGVPVSAQSKAKELKAAYRRKVIEAARDSMGILEPFDTAVRLMLAIFSEGGILPDVDNVLKLVQDALQGVVYVNDRWVDDHSTYRRSLDEPLTVVGTSELLVRTLTQGTSFIYVCVTTDINRAVIR